MAHVLPNTMHAWRKHLGNLQPQWDEVPVPKAPANGYLLKVLAAGVCHSDFMLVMDPAKGSPRMQDIYILGHEGCGEVVAVGKELDESGKAKFKIGDVVAVHPGSGAETKHCWGCSRNGVETVPGMLAHGIGMDGSFAEYVAVLEHGLSRVPEGVTPEQAAVTTDAVMTAHHAIVHRGHIRAGQTVLLIGLGGLGMNALQILLHLGAKPIVSDTRQGPLDEALALGVPESHIIPVGRSITEIVMERKLAIDVVMDFVCLPKTISDAQDVVRGGGTILVIGLLSPEVPIKSVVCAYKQVDIKFCFGGHTSDIADGLALIASGKLTPRVERSSLKEFPQVLAALHQGKIKSRMVLIP